MAAIDFPASPTLNDTHIVGSITYLWDGAKWKGGGITPIDRLVEDGNILDIQSNNLVWTGGNFGVGTDNPQNKVHISSSNTVAHFQSNTSYSDIRFTNSSSSNGFIGYYGTNLNFYANSTSTPTITIAGGAPGSLLVGGSFVSGNASGARLQINSTSQYDGIVLGAGASYSTISRQASGTGLVFTANANPANLGGGDPTVYEWWSGSSGGGGPNLLAGMTTTGKFSIGSSSPSNGEYGSITPNLYVKGPTTNGVYSLVARFEAGFDANSTGAAVLINHVNDRGLLIEGGRGGEGAYDDNQAVAHFGLVNNVGVNTRFLTAREGGLIGINQENPSYNLEVNGSFAATTKSFVIDHPTKEGMKLRYGSLEGPENGVYVRGKTTEFVIELPDYWTGLVDEDTITVNLTPFGKTQTLWVKEIKDNKVFVGSKCTTVEYFYTVFGERKDVEKLEVEF